MIPIMISRRVQPKRTIRANAYQSTGRAHRVRFHTAAKGT